MRGLGARIGFRLAAGFGVAVVLVIAVGLSGHLGTSSTHREVVRLYETTLPALDSLVETDRDLQQLLVAERSMIFADVASEEFTSLKADYDENLQQSAERWSTYRALAAQSGDTAEMDAYESARAAWLELTTAIVQGRMSDTRDGRRLAIDLSLGQGAEAFDAMREHLNVLQEGLLGEVETAREEADATYVRTAALSFTAMGVAILVGVLLSFFITAGITRPLGVLTRAADQIAAGRLALPELAVKGHDELADLARAFRAMTGALAAKGAVLERMAGGDMTAEVHMASDTDELGESLRITVSSLHDLISQTRVSVSQINAGADQVAQASQSLSQGATEQASALEEVSASLSEISGQARRNAESATTANQLARAAVGNAEKGNQQMTELAGAMDLMNTGSREISKIVKLIDDIAFQINLLALNANVEAARAGKYGKGFAVVADEVRNLAVRSAAAVKDTTRMVEQTTGSIDAGGRIAQAAVGQFGQIVTSVGKVADLLDEISQASREQAEGVAQITTGLHQVDEVTQANTAGAEESAAAAQELASQVQELGAHISRFTVRETPGRETPASPRRATIAKSPVPDGRRQLGGF